MIVIAQGRKRVDLGTRSFVYDESNYLITSADLPIITRVVDATESKPCLAMMLKLELPLVREIVGGEEVDVAGPPPSLPAMTTAPATPELLDACCRLVDLLGTPQDIPFLGGLLEREILYRVLRGPEGTRLRAIATLGDQSQRTAKALVWMKENFSRPVRVEDLAEIAGMGVSSTAACSANRRCAGPRPAKREGCGRRRRRGVLPSFLRSSEPRTQVAIRYAPRAAPSAACASRTAAAPWITLAMRTAARIVSSLMPLPRSTFSCDATQVPQPLMAETAVHQSSKSTGSEPCDRMTCIRSRAGIWPYFSFPLRCWKR